MKYCRVCKGNGNITLRCIDLGKMLFECYECDGTGSIYSSNKNKDKNKVKKN